MRLPPGNLPDLGVEPMSPVCPGWAPCAIQQLPAAPPTSYLFYTCYVNQYSHYVEQFEDS